MAPVRRKIKHPGLFIAPWALFAACGQSTSIPCPEPPGRPADPALFASPLGSARRPHPVASFPYVHQGDTALFGQSRIHRYGCAPVIRESGPEVHYALHLLGPGLVRAALRAPPGVDVDLHLLEGQDPARCLGRADQELEISLPAGAFGLVVDTHGDAAGPYVLEVTVTRPRPVLLGAFFNTYYYLANELDHDGPADAPLLDAGCGILAEVPQTFHDDLCIEGSGILRDGRIVNFARRCTFDCFAALPCGRSHLRRPRRRVRRRRLRRRRLRRRRRQRRVKVCYRELDPALYPWGMGAEGRVLVPDRSVAVDSRVVPLGAVLYLEELDGVVPPGASRPHDGCVRADDVGGAVRGLHLDFFAGTRGRWQAWEQIFPTRSEFTVYLHHPRCLGRPASGDGAGSAAGR